MVQIPQMHQAEGQLQYLEPFLIWAWCLFFEIIQFVDVSLQMHLLKSIWIWEVLESKAQFRSGWKLSPAEEFEPKQTNRVMFICLALNNPLKVCFSNKKTTITTQTCPTQIVKVYFLLKNCVLYEFNYILLFVQI